jgi:hypothetical protein
MAGRRWSDGLHQAVEAKEALPIQNESITLASVSYQAFFRNFPKLAGMTGARLARLRRGAEAASCLRRTPTEAGERGLLASAGSSPVLQPPAPSALVPAGVPSSFFCLVEGSPPCRAPTLQARPPRRCPSSTASTSCRWRWCPPTGPLGATTTPTSSSGWRSTSGRQWSPRSGACTRCAAASWPHPGRVPAAPCRWRARGSSCHGLCVPGAHCRLLSELHGSWVAWLALPATPPPPPAPPCAPQAGRPILVGTTSVEKSEMLSEMLQAEGIKHQVGRLPGGACWRERAAWITDV